MLLVVGEHVLDDRTPQCAQMAICCVSGLGNTQQEICGALNGCLRMLNECIQVGGNWSSCPPMGARSSAAGRGRGRKRMR